MARIRFTEPTLIALSGGNFKAATEHMKVLPNKLYLMEKGDVLAFTETKRTSRVYLAIGGGFELDEWLGSTSTDFKSQQNVIINYLKILKNAEKQTGV